MDCERLIFGGVAGLRTAETLRADTIAIGKLIKYPLRQGAQPLRLYKLVMHSY